MTDPLSAVSTIFKSRQRTSFTGRQAFSNVKSSLPPAAIRELIFQRRGQLASEPSAEAASSFLLVFEKVDEFKT